MKRAKTPSFILELPLKSCPSVEKRLESRFESGRQIYNACLGEAMRRLRLMRQSKGWAAARKMEKGKNGKSKARNEADQNGGPSSREVSLAHPRRGSR